MRSRRSITALGLALAATVAVLALAGVAFAKARVFHLHLTGAAEVPKADGGSANARLSLNPANGRVCWAFTNFKRVPHRTVAHIHQAPKGQAGGVVVPLGGAFKARGCTTAPRATVRAIVKHPRRYYVNVHTIRFPNGAIRAQL